MLQCTTVRHNDSAPSFRHLNNKLKDEEKKELKNNFFPDFEVKKKS